MKKWSLSVWLARVLIGIVFLFNVQCAVLFIWQPDRFAPAYELGGGPGRAAVVGIGILFLMWNVPYFFALLQPLRNRHSLWEAICMQVIGLAGEGLLRSRIPMEHELLRSSTLRFILFDALGLFLLLAAMLLVRFTRKHNGSLIA